MFCKVDSIAVKGHIRVQVHSFVPSVWDIGKNVESLRFVRHTRLLDFWRVRKSDGRWREIILSKYNYKIITFALCALCKHVVNHFDDFSINCYPDRFMISNSQYLPNYSRTVCFMMFVIISVSIAFMVRTRSAVGEISWMRYISSFWVSLRHESDKYKKYLFITKKKKLVVMSDEIKIRFWFDKTLQCKTNNIHNIIIYVIFSVSFLQP